jgi:hypothetical protein
MAIFPFSPGEGCSDWFAPRDAVFFCGFALTPEDAVFFDDISVEANSQQSLLEFRPSHEFEIELLRKKEGSKDAASTPIERPGRSAVCGCGPGGFVSRKLE